MSRNEFTCNLGLVNHLKQIRETLTDPIEIETIDTVQHSPRGMLTDPAL